MAAQQRAAAANQTAIAAHDATLRLLPPLANLVNWLREERTGMFHLAGADLRTDERLEFLSELGRIRKLWLEARSSVARATDGLKHHKKVVSVAREFLVRVLRLLDENRTNEHLATVHDSLFPPEEAPVASEGWPLVAIVLKDFTLRDFAYRWRTRLTDDLAAATVTATSGGVAEPTDAGAGADEAESSWPEFCGPAVSYAEIVRRTGWRSSHQTAKGPPDPGTLRKRAKRDSDMGLRTPYAMLYETGVPDGRGRISPREDAARYFAQKKNLQWTEMPKPAAVRKVRKEASARVRQTS